MICQIDQEEDGECLRNQAEIGNSYNFVLDIPSWKKQKHQWCTWKIKQEIMEKTPVVQKGTQHDF